MRPSHLFPLFVDLSSLRGIGPKQIAHYKRLCGTKAIHLLFHLPEYVIERPFHANLTSSLVGSVGTWTVTVVAHDPPARSGRPYRVICEDEGHQEITLTFFHAKGDYHAKLLPVGEKRLVSGLLERYGRSFVMPHPDYVVTLDRQAEIPLFDPVYPLTEGLTRKGIQKTVRLLLDKLPDNEEWIEPSLLRSKKWPSWKEALLILHTPRSRADVDRAKDARERLAYDELLAEQLALGIIREHHKKVQGRPMQVTGALTDRLRDILPFRLTAGQDATFKEIQADLASGVRMLRLLQGDVGSGKTVVALLAILSTIEAGFQAALMVPTEVLARQHAAKIKEWFAPLGVRSELLVGATKSVERKTILKDLAEGTLSVVIGTHALFQDKVSFANLGLVVLDEQHRFGVQQRLKLSEKGSHVDVLAMTATPIPRTLCMTVYGDMDVSRLNEKPAGRKPVDTRLVDMNRMDEILGGLARHLKTGAQAYWICPLVEESEKSDLAAATERLNLLREYLGQDAVDLIHGQMSSADKESAMERFVQGATKVLVATTVIEVGVDVPNASLIIIEHSERFGLAQLHQLRGRVGRGSSASVCLLLYKGPLTQVAQKRLTKLRETEDGFLIAEEDLKLRGPGEFLGTKQSGLPDYRVARLDVHADLLDPAYKDSCLAMATDPDLSLKRGNALRSLLYLFEKDAAVRLFRS